MDGLNDLIRVSRDLGQRPDLVQGGGGNTSLKTESHMWIKASGLVLAEVSTQAGFVKVDDSAIRAGLGGVTTEEGYVSLVQRNVLSPEGTGRPSMETGFHALLGRCVLHSHSVWTNVLACSREVEPKLKALLPDVLFVAYAAPGLPLMKVVAAALAESPRAEALVLQNHGLIVSAPTVEAAWARHRAVDAAIRAAFLLPERDFEQFSTVAAGDDLTRVLFPDQVVYLTQPLLRQSPAGRETARAYGFIRQAQDRLGLTPHFLGTGDVQMLLNLEAEKYRQRVSQSSDR